MAYFHESYNCGSTCKHGQFFCGIAGGKCLAPTFYTKDGVDRIMSHVCDSIDDCGNKKDEDGCTIQQADDFIELKSSITLEYGRCWNLYTIFYIS